MADCDEWLATHRANTQPSHNVLDKQIFIVKIEQEKFMCDCH